MRWQRGTRSHNIDDRRARRSPGRRRVGGGLSLGGVLAILAISWFLGINPMTFLGGNVGSGSVGLGGGGLAGGAMASGEFRTTPEEEELVDFVSFVLDDLQATWRELLPGYRDATLVLFRDATRSGCGVGQSEMGPFYCGADEHVYIDLSFYAQLRSQFGAPGDFAQAYVLAHEIGHHLQTLTGISDTVRQRQQADPASRNDLSVRQELQADCFAGVWGYSTAQRGNLDPDDVEEGLRAAAAIGDDRIQRMGGRGVHPESFTHGSSAQRVEWLRRGLESGDPDSCNTF
jgi:predicted metalloprotease